MKGAIVLSKEKLTNETLRNAIEAQKIGAETELEKVTVQFLEELKQYRELEDQGLLLKLPCKLRSAIWDNDFGNPYKYDVTGFSYGDLNEDEYFDEELPTDELILHYANHTGSITGRFPVSALGESVFLTQLEAEEKLKKAEETLSKI